VDDSFVRLGGPSLERDRAAADEPRAQTSRATVGEGRAPAKAAETAIPTAGQEAAAAAATLGIVAYGRAVARCDPEALAVTPDMVLRAGREVVEARPGPP
jgi:hypothetical protein